MFVQIVAVFASESDRVYAGFRQRPYRINSQQQQWFTQLYDMTLGQLETTAACNI